MSLTSMKLSWPRIFNWLIKILFFGFILLSFAMRNMPQFEGKGILIRVLTYPIAALVVPIFWRFKLRGKPYPEIAEGLILWPFIVDLFGNLAYLYDTIPHFDDAAHLLNWCSLMAGNGLLLSNFNLTRLNKFALIVGLGATAAVLWEAGEYFAMKTGASHLFLTYEDTMGDLTLGLAGSFFAAVLISKVRTE